MKKLTTLLLALCMLFSLTACGGDASSNTSNGTESGAISSEPEDGAQSSEPEKKPSVPQKEITFTEMVAVDNENCAITCTKMEWDEVWGYTLEVLLENRSTDKSYDFSVESAAVNGVQMDPYFIADVAPGEQSTEKIIFHDDTLEANGITEYSDIELTFRVYDSDDINSDDAAYETFHVYPYGEENAVPFTRKPQPTDQVLLDNDSLTVTAIGYEEDETYGYTVNLFLVNKTDQKIIAGIDDASVNGCSADPFYATSVEAGKSIFGQISWANSTLEENDISEVKEIEFTISAYAAGDWSDGDFGKETVTLKP